jgi:hypothetical protein
MATRSKTTFRKRQKEIARKEKQRMKAEKRAQRKLTPLNETEDQQQDAGLPLEGPPDADAPVI